MMDDAARQIVAISVRSELERCGLQFVDGAARALFESSLISTATLENQGVRVEGMELGAAIQDLARRIPQMLLRGAPAHADINVKMSDEEYRAKARELAALLSEQQRA